MQKYKNWLSGILIGLIVGFKSIIFSISYTSLIFSGFLAPYLPYGIGIALFSCAVLSLIISTFSKIPDVVAQPQHVVSALLAFIASSIAKSLHEQGLNDQIIPTVFATIALSTLMLGICFLLLGYFGLGRLIRFIPYPVIGGVIAGIGWLILIKALSIMSVAPVTISNLFDWQTLIHIAPGIVIGVVLYLFSSSAPVLFIPGLLVLATLLFYGVFWTTGVPISPDWLIVPLPSGLLWPPLSLTDLEFINWHSIAGQTIHIMALILTGVFYFLMTSSGLELVTKKDVDIDWELQTTGIANILAGSGGGLAGYQTLMLSSFSNRMGASANVGFICAMMAVAALLFNISFLNYLPKFILGGLVIFFGLSLLIDWAFLNRKKIPRFDYLLVLLIVAVIGIFDFIPGVMVGILAAIIMFIISYSHTNVIKYELTGADFHSNVDRPFNQQNYLQKAGNQIYIINLQSFIFFGTAYGLYEKIKKHLELDKTNEVKYIVLDFHRVTGMDSSAANSFAKLGQLTKQRKIKLVFTDLAPDLSYFLMISGFIKDNDQSFQFFDTLDYGVEWCENQILSTAGILRETTFIPEPIKKVLPFFERQEFQAGSTIMRQDEQSNEFYFIESGNVSILLTVSDGRVIRLRSIEGGSFVGELGYFLGTPRSSSVVAETHTVLYRITKKELKNLLHQNPDISSSFHDFVERMLSERLIHSNKIVQALI